MEVPCEEVGLGANCMKRSCHYWSKEFEEHCSAPTLEKMAAVSCPGLMEKDERSHETAEHLLGVRAATYSRPA